MEKTVLINRWDGGIVNDPRTPIKNVCSMVSNFDILTDPYRMLPYRDSEDGDTIASTRKPQNFCVALRTGTTYSLYALGVVSGTGKAEVNYKALSTGGSGDLGDNGWSSTANNASAAGATSFVLFVYYKKTGLIYGAKGGTTIWAYDPSGGVAFDDAARSITYTDIAQGLVHSKDDILYIPYDNKIAKNNNGSWTDAALTLPSNYKITSICEYGNYLAIGCAPVNNVGNSRVYLWDRDSSLATISESIDWGEGILTILEEVGGELLGISLKSGNSTLFDYRLIFRKLSGSLAIKISEIVSSSTITLPPAKQKFNGRLYFLASITIKGTAREGLWSVGRNSIGQLSIIHERTPNNDTALVSSSNLYSFIIVGDYVFISYLTNSANALSKTNDASSYTATSVRETQIFNGGDSSIVKRLIGATVMTEVLPAAGQVVLKYKKDEETSWTRIFLHGTDSSISHSATSVEIGQDTITMTIASPAVVTLTNHDLIAGQKIKFRTTGALPTGVVAGTDYYVISAGLAADTFRFSATSGGSAVNTSGTQSGTHTLERDAVLPEFKEIQFMIESTGNAVITGLKFKYELLDKDMY